MTQATELTSIHFAFQISRKIVFEVNYYRCGGNEKKHFSTSAAQFNQPKTDYNRCGQAQNDLLKGYNKAMSFYRKWDLLHLSDLTPVQYEMLLIDIEVLKATYNFITSDKENIGFISLKELSMLKVKK